MSATNDRIDDLMNNGDFVGWLEDRHDKNYVGLDDDMADACDEWIGNLDLDKLEEYYRQFCKDREINLQKARDLKAKTSVLHPVMQDILNVYTKKPRLSDKYSHEEDYIYEFVTGFVNDFNKHNVDKKRIMAHVSHIVRNIEDLAMDIENGEYDEPPQERDE